MKAFSSLFLFISIQKKSQLNQHLSNSQPYSQIRFFGFLLFQQLFSATDKMWKVNGFLHHLFPHLKMEADVSHLHRSLQCAATRGPSSLKVYYRGPERDAARPKTESARCVEGKFSTHSCTFNKSNHIRTLRFQILLSAMGTHSRAEFD